MVKFRDLLTAIRIKQWSKNGFIFAAIVFDGQLFNRGSFFKALAGFILLCLLNSGIYLINDLIDLKADQNHPKKKFRPIAAGKISLRSARVFAGVLLTAALAGSFALTLNFFLVLLTILALNVIYSRLLKHIPLIDVITIGLLFILRVIAGVVLIKVKIFSPWLYLVTFMLALYLGFGKRRSELVQIGDRVSETRRALEGYTIPLLDQLITIVSSVTIMSYSLYTFSGPTLPGNHSMMLTIPIVILGIFRYHYLIHTRQSGGAPEEVLFSDHFLQGTVAVFVVLVILLLYFWS